MDEQVARNCLQTCMDGLTQEDIDVVMEFVGNLRLNEAELGENFILSALLQTAACVYSIRMEERSKIDNLPSPGFFKSLKYLDELIEYSSRANDDTD